MTLSNALPTLPKSLIHRDISVSSPKLIKWLLDNTREWKADNDTLFFLKGDFKYQIYFKTSKLHFNRFLKKYVKISNDKGGFFLMSKQQFNNEIESNAKLYFSRGCSRIHGTETMVDRFVKLMQKKFGEDSIKIMEA